ncbi:hypothetical protein TNIN_422841 [Trichonephila inaurata madagascariensis]|uniref:Uncharacterized protein n=1 Tax=Trichonephila inaurata madagascariensis TaxID=2747483 RepID=A0A8X6IXM1_9ARAC|nr:hypothetical protein TNIN_422841 [Trichonephila inaurata madagascariensis]
MDTPRGENANQSQKNAAPKSKATSCQPLVLQVHDNVRKMYAERHRCFSTFYGVIQERFPPIPPNPINSSLACKGGFPALRISRMKTPSLDLTKSKNVRSLNQTFAKINT